MNASKGASSILINMYCLLENFDNTSRITNTLNCFSKPGALKSILGRLRFSFSWKRYGFLSERRNFLDHSDGPILRVLVRFPYSSSTFASTILKICSLLTLPQQWHSLSFQSAW